MTSQMRTRTVAPHQFLPRRRSLGQELRLIANRSGQPDAGLPLSPIIHRKRPASVDNSQLDKRLRSLDDFCSSPQKVPRLLSPTTETNGPCSLPIKTSSLLLRRIASDDELKRVHLNVTEPKFSDFIIQASSPLAAKNYVTRSQVLAAHNAIAGIPGLECQSSRRTSRMNVTMSKYTTTRTSRLHPIATSQPTPVRLSVSPTTVRDQTFNAFGGLARFSSAAPKGMATSPTDTTRSAPSTPGNFSRSSKSPLTPQNLQTATQFFPFLGTYIPTTGTATGYYFPTINGTQGAYYPQLGSPVGPFYTAPLPNCRQYHQTLATNGNSLGSYYPSYDEGLMQAGPYVGSFIPNSISPGLSTQNSQFYYQIPVINSTNDCQYITATASTSPNNVYSQNTSDQTAWNYLNRMVSPNQIVDNYNSQGTVELNTLPFNSSGDAIQRLQAEGAGVSPSRLLGQHLYYQTPGFTTLPIDNNVLYPISSGQSGYQANSEGLNMMGRSEPLSSPQTRNCGHQVLPFLLSDMGLSPRKKMASLVSQTTERPGIHPTENQWISHSLSQWQRNFH